MRKLICIAWGFAIGMVMWAVLTPIAQKSRRNPASFGGEAMSPIAGIAIGATFAHRVEKEEADAENNKRHGAERKN